MELVGRAVRHNVLGKGRITALADGLITVDFEVGTQKKFAYPSSIGAFLELKDKSVARRVEQDKREAARLEVEEKLAKDKMKQELARQEQVISRTRSRASVSLPKFSNIAFKCNYCDGGSSTEAIGYKSVCSDEVIKYNVNVAKREWCKRSDCKRYLEGEFTRRQLVSFCEDDGYVCYESQMLRLWRAYAGVVQNGEKAGTPMRLLQVRANSLAILTTRLPNAREEDRIIFAVFLVDENYEGDNKDEGYVGANPKYRTQLSLPEAQQLKFWDYYSNPGKPEKMQFSSGLYRYFTDVQAAQVLRRICDIKRGKAQQKIARELFEHFCTIKKLDKDKVPAPHGALQS